MGFKKFPEDILAALKSQRGHNLLVFAAFLAVATFLWWVMALNEEDQCDVRMPVRVTNVPDTVTIITAIPDNLTVSLRAHGSQLMKLNWGKVPVLDIDFRAYRQRSSMRLSDADLKALVRQRFDGANIIVVSPDTINLAYTTNPGVLVPIKIDYIVSPGAQSTLAGKPRLSTDSVRIFSIKGGDFPSEVTTDPIRLSGINQSTTKRVRLIAPAGTRLIPDSVDVTFDVEPLIYKTRKVTVQAVNTPADKKLITFPAQVDVRYLIPMSVYKVSDPVIRLQVDYREIDASRSSDLLPINIVEVSDYLQNVQLSVDSVEYIIEML